MEELRELLYRYMTETLTRVILSGSREKEAASKIHIRPVVLKGQLMFQSSEYKENKVYHRNMERREAVDQVCEWMEKYRQMELSGVGGQAHVLASKKGKLTIKEKPAAKCGSCTMRPADLSHNRKKKYILEPDLKVEFLIDLGVMTKEGKIVHAQYDKFRQINRFLEFIEDVLPKLPKDREVTILDFGCGKSYLTFAMYYYLKELKGYAVQITGLDLKADVIAHCNRLAEKYGYESLKFYVGDIAGYEGVSQVDMVVTLHACDTATDYALDKAIRWGAKVILSVPCCQHELNGQMENEILGSVFRYGLIKERMAALFTDALRAQLLERKGYEVQILEFIDMEHTPKNILIRAVKGKNMAKESSCRELMDFLHVKPTLAVLQGEIEESEPALVNEQIEESEPVLVGKQIEQEGSDE